MAHERIVIGRMAGELVVIGWPLHEGLLEEMEPLQEHVGLRCHHLQYAQYVLTHFILWQDFLAILRVQEFFIHYITGTYYVKWGKTYSSMKSHNFFPIQGSENLSSTKMDTYFRNGQIKIPRYHICGQWSCQSCESALIKCRSRSELIEKNTDPTLTLIISGGKSNLIVWGGADLPRRLFWCFYY